MYLEFIAQKRVIVYQLVFFSVKLFDFSWPLAPNWPKLQKSYQPNCSFMNFFSILTILELLRTVFVSYSFPPKVSLTIFDQLYAE